MHNRKKYKNRYYIIEFPKIILFFLLERIFCAIFLSQYTILSGISNKLFLSTFFPKKEKFKKEIFARIEKLIGI